MIGVVLSINFDKGCWEKGKGCIGNWRL